MRTKDIGKLDELFFREGITKLQKARAHAIRAMNFLTDAEECMLLWGEFSKEKKALDLPIELIEGQIERLVKERGKK